MSHVLFDFYHFLFQLLNTSTYKVYVYVSLASIFHRLSFWSQQFVPMHPTRETIPNEGYSGVTSWLFWEAHVFF